jgi:hypothetical protein
MFTAAETLPLISCWCLVGPDRAPAWFDAGRGLFVGSGLNGRDDWEIPLDPQPTAWTFYLAPKS